MLKSALKYQLCQCCSDLWLQNLLKLKYKTSVVIIIIFDINCYFWYSNTSSNSLSVYFKIIQKDCEKKTKRFKKSLLIPCHDHRHVSVNVRSCVLVLIANIWLSYYYYCSLFSESASQPFIPSLSSPNPPQASPSSSSAPDELQDEEDIEYDLSPTDVALATAPGEQIYNPRDKKFSDTELKPQPMIKKSRKVFVPEERKDNRYWERRRKNNIAAKRSRDARRIKENQIVLRASFLETQNGGLKDDLTDLKKENMSLKKLISNLENQLRAVHEGKL